MGNQLGKKSGEFHFRLLRAVNREDVEVVRYLLKKNDTDIEHMEDGFTALSLAVQHRNKQIVEMLISAGAQVTGSGSKVRVFPLLIAILRQDTEIVELLLDSGSDVNIKTEREAINLLHVAVQNSGEGGTVDWMAEGKAKDMSKKPSAQRSLRIIELLIRAGVDFKAVDHNDNTIMHFCCQYNNVLAAHYFLNNVEWLSTEALHMKNTDGDAPIHIALKSCHENLALMLIHHGLDLQLETLDGSSLLTEAARYQCGEVVRTLVSIGCHDVNKKNKKTGETALHASIPKRIGCSDDKIQQILLKRPGIEVDTADMTGVTALHLAVRQSNTVLVDVLLSYQASCHVGDHKQRTSLHIAEDWGSWRIALIGSSPACFTGNEHIVKSIINSKLYGEGYIDQQDIAQKTALFIATSMGHEAIVKEMLHHKAGVNIVDKFGNSPLYKAVQMGYNNIAELLIQAGANVDQYNEDGRGPLHAAVTYPKCDVHMSMILLTASCDPVNLDEFLDFLIQGGILGIEDFADREMELFNKLKYNPKPLKHWCRCVIIDSLPNQKYKTEFWTALCNLKLPKVLTTYLNVKLL